MKERDENARRWYDRDPILSKAMRILETSDDKIQIQVAINLIKIIIEHNIEDNSYSSLDDIISAVEEGGRESGNSRWYDIDNTLKTAIQMLKHSSAETQTKITQEIVELITKTFKRDDDED